MADQHQLQTHDRKECFHVKQFLLLSTPLPLFYSIQYNVQSAHKIPLALALELRADCCGSRDHEGTKTKNPSQWRTLMLCTALGTACKELCSVRSRCARISMCAMPATTAS